MDKIVTDPLYLKCKRMVETCNKNQTEMAKKYLDLADEKFVVQISELDTMDWFENFYYIKRYFKPLRDKLEELNG
jgi:hypothetical protein